MNGLQRWIANITGIGAEVEKVKGDLEQKHSAELEQIKTDLNEQRGGLEVIVEAFRQNRANERGLVTPNQSLRVAAVWACVRVLSETMASLPLILYERLPEGKRRAQDHYLYPILHDRPNPAMTAFQYREVLQASLALWGNAYSRIYWDERGRVTELWPLLPGGMIETANDELGRRLYHYQYPDGEMEWLSEDEVWQIPGMGGNGRDGYSPIGLMRRTIGLAMDAEEFGARFFQNDARPGVILSHPKVLSDKAKANIEESYVEKHQGVEKSHRPMVLEEGMAVTEIGIPPEDAQFLETRQFQVREIARIFRVPPHMIGDLEQATFSNIEHQAIEFVMHTVRPWAVRWEQSIMLNLLLKRDQQRYYAEHLVDGLLRGDIAARYAAYAIGKQNGFLSANDIRTLENMDPIEGGDVYYVPMNMIPADLAAEGLTFSEPAPSAPPSTARALPLVREERALRSARARHRLAAAQRKVIFDVAQRAMRRETHDVGEAVRKYLGNPQRSAEKRDSAQLLIWLEEFYQEHSNWLKKAYLPIFQAYAELVAAEALDEVGVEEDLRERLERFVRSYAGSFGAQQAGISLYRLKQLLQEALNEGRDPVEAFEDELESWQESRPAQIAAEQSIRAGSAVVKMVYTAVGVRLLRWMAFGDTCPYCRQLDGRVVEINKYFLAPGQELTVEGAAALTTTTYIGHPPAHDGCDCTITAA